MYCDPKPPTHKDVLQNLIIVKIKTQDAESKELPRRKSGRSSTGHDAPPSLVKQQAIPASHGPVDALKKAFGVDCGVRPDGVTALELILALIVLTRTRFPHRVRRIHFGFVARSGAFPAFGRDPSKKEKKRSVE